MTFGLSAAAIAGLAVGVGGVASAYIGAQAAGDAASAQSASAQAGIGEQARQFDALKQLLAPYVQAGNGAIGAQQNLIGLNGNAAQMQAINGIKNSSQFEELARQGETGILQNASATGGLRGGNTQGALAQFRPALLNQLISQQYTNLGGLTSIGQNAAAGTGNAGMQSANAISALLQQQGAAQAGGYLAAGRGEQQGLNSMLQGLSLYSGMGGLSGGGFVPTGQGGGLF